MKNLVVNFEKEEYKTVFVSYHDRIVDCYKSTWIIYSILFVGFIIASNFVSALCVIIFLLLFNTIEYREWSKCHISRIIRNGIKLQISYFIKDKEYVIEDEAIAFQFKKKNLWYKMNGGAPYLEINHNGRTIVKQFVIGDINPAVFDKIIKEFS